MQTKLHLYALLGQAGDLITTLVALFLFTGFYEANRLVAGDATGGELFLRVCIVKLVCVGLLLAYRKRRLVQVAGLAFGGGATVINSLSMLVWVLL
jgi:hypothetical protein